MMGDAKFNPLDYRLSFLRPLRLTQASGWVQHIPFAYALMEMCQPRTLVELGTHYGDSYCAFCQAVVELKIATRCTAIDTWSGDQNTGPYSENVLESLRAFHDPRFGSFSLLKQTTFEDALRDFTDGSIDLLHIDGCHHYEAVKHDFESWLPKLSDRGVVIMHDTIEKKEGFGVYRLWDEVASKYPSLNFRHAHGLGVLAIGHSPPSQLIDFLKLTQHADTREDVLDFYHHEGWMIEVLRTMSGMVSALQDTYRALDERKRMSNSTIELPDVNRINKNPVEAIRKLWPAFEAIGRSGSRTSE